MRVLVHRVKQASVSAEGHETATIGPGLLAYIGISNTDTASDVRRAAKKLLSLRLFPEPIKGAEWDQTFVQREYSILLVPQFTLMADTQNGSKPNLRRAMSAAQGASDLFSQVVEKVQTELAPHQDRVQSGWFGTENLVTSETEFVFSLDTANS